MSICLIAASCPDSVTAVPTIAANQSEGRVGARICDQISRLDDERAVISFLHGCDSTQIKRRRRKSIE